MTQIVVTLEEGSNLSIIRSAIDLIKGVKNTMITHVESKTELTKTDRRLKVVDHLAGSISLDMIDSDDPRTQYLLSK